jgi:glycosyltransferase involved in cell wall biosynthesis
MPLHLGVDAWNLTSDRRGIGRYVREIVSQWTTWGPEAVRLTLLVPERAAWFVRRRYLRELDGANIPIRHRGAARTLDAVWYPWNGMSWVAGVTSVATLHDASLFAIPPKDERIAEKEQRPLRVAAALAQRVITDSQFSKAELLRYLPLDASRIEVIPLGVKDVFARARQTAARAPARPYVLFVGEPEKRKGLSTLFQAMALLPDSVRKTTDLVLAGASEEYPVPQSPDTVSVRNLGWVGDEELASLYANAAAFVYPSEYEGFGLPMVEAMASGAPVIASDVPSLREAGANGADYVRPDAPQELAAAIGAVLGDPIRANHLRERGLARGKQLSWEQTARKTLAVIEHAVKAER